MSNEKLPLHDYQIYCKNFALTHPYCALYLKMGLGKTIIMLETLYEMNPTEHVLIIAPKTVAKSTWLSEIEKWKLPLRAKSLIENEKGKDYNKKEREKAFMDVIKEPPTVYVINKEMITKLVNFYKDISIPWPFKHVIIDESQSFKSYSSKRFKSLTSVRPYMKTLRLLTGSPTPNGYMDLWAQIYLLDGGARLGKNISTYRNIFFKPGIIIDDIPVTWNLLPGAKEIIDNKISDIVISMANDFLKLPELTINNVSIKMNPNELKKYKKFAKEKVLDLDENLTVTAANRAVLSGKLSQMASGTLYTDLKTHEYEVIHNKKLEMCEYIIENTDDNIIIAYHFKSDLEELEKFLKEKGYEYEVFRGENETKNKWNQKKIPILLLQPSSGGVGVNLQEGGATLIWYTLPWSLESYEQTNARIYRQGQKKPCIIHHLLTEGTIDVKKLEKLEKKDASQQAMIDAVKVTLNDINGGK